MIDLFASPAWRWFLIFFAIFAKSLWFFYYSALYLFEPKQRTKLYHGKTALIVPIFNEDAGKLTATIKAAKKVQGLDEIIFVNDGSQNNVLETLKKHDDGTYKIVDLPKNMGKREAQFAGVRVADRRTRVFVFMDSDTILQKRSIKELTKPMRDPAIGGVTSMILVKNKDENFLTRTISAMYWTASNIWRQAPSNLGFVQVTNGQLSCYRASLIRKLRKEYLNQDFLGVRCMVSDDRFITHYIQTKFDKRIIYAKSSIVHTYVPNNFKGAYKMFLRWKVGSIREAIRVIPQFPKRPMLVIDIWANHLISIMQTIVRIGVIAMAVYDPMVLLYYLIIIVVVSLLFALHMLIENPKEVPYRISYSILNELIFGWVYVHALLTIRNQGRWGTR